MGEDLSQQDILAFVEEMKEIPQAVIVEDALLALDASMATLIYHHPFGESLRSNGTTFTRMERTPGFIFWFVRDRSANEYGAIAFRVADATRVIVSIYPGPYATSGPQAEIAYAVLRYLLGTLLQHRDEDLKAVEELAKRPDIATKPYMLHPDLVGILGQFIAPRGPGRPKDEDNLWAQRELAAGRDYDSTLAEWMRRRHVDPSDRAAVRRERDLFRRNVTKKKGRK